MRASEGDPTASWQAPPRMAGTVAGHDGISDGTSVFRAGYTRIGISTYSALESAASCTTVGAAPSAKRNST